MTREEAVIILDGFKNNPLFNEQHIEALDMAVTALSENKGEWIPVSERLPKAFETVLRTRVENGWNGTTYTIVDIGCICPADHNIVAWMPLPDYYKGEAEHE